MPWWAILYISLFLVKLPVQSLTSLHKWAYLRQVRLRERNQCGRSWDVCRQPTVGCSPWDCKESEQPSDPGWATCWRWQGNSRNQGQAGRWAPTAAEWDIWWVLESCCLFPDLMDKNSTLHGLGEAMRGWTLAGSENRERENSERDFEDSVFRNWATHWMEYKRQTWC